MNFLRPTTIEAATQLLAQNPDTTVLSGGTDLMVEVNLAHRRPETVLSTRAIEELRQYRSDFIGAGVTFGELESSSYPALSQLSRTVGSPQIRAAATVGGNLGTASPAGDSIPFMMAAEAKIVLASVDGTRSVAADEFFVGPKQTSRTPKELIVGIELPALPTRQAFSKIGVRQAMVIATCSAVVLRSDDGTTHVAVGAVGPTVLRMRAAEELVSGPGSPDQETLERFEQLVASEVRPISDHRSTADYRRRSVAVLARRTLERCL